MASSAQEYLQQNSDHEALLKNSDDGLETGNGSEIPSQIPENRCLCYKKEGRVHVIGEFKSAKKLRRYIVIGPDWPCVLITYIAIIVPSILIEIFLIADHTESIVYYVLLGICLLSLTIVFFADAGMVRKYKYARTRYWTYCDHCESFRPPGSVHCSTCQVCIKGYDHHCPWTGKCIGEGNITMFKIFVVTLCWLLIFCIAISILKALHMEM
mmetsp:Transcript_17371/g.17458  ORF Transcript_17371/g.17458 Transcript_17371/m.17458 type:complete len:212 (+) Transcript_17371:136-771(+)